MGQSCIFCQIAEGSIKADIVYEDDEIVAFKDINPMAPVHVLIIPRVHIENVNTVEEEHVPLLGKMFLVAKQVAQNMGVYDKGYRLVINTRAMAGQSVFHIHMHLLGGRPMRWPPG